jgi:hypothetical protein
LKEQKSGEKMKNVCFSSKMRIHSYVSLTVAIV